MIRSSDIYIFLITIFIAITFTHTGMYLSDELSPANQLHQLSINHQVTYHELKYGVYNTTIDKSIIGTNYVMTYPLLVPLLSLPLYTILLSLPFLSTVLPIVFWLFIIISLITIVNIWYGDILKKKFMYLYIILLVSIFVNILNYSNFDTSNFEILSITFVNIISYGVFSVFVWKLINYIFCGNTKRIFMWIAVMSCSSLLFWVGTLKDHVIISMLMIIILYCLIKFYDLNDTIYLTVLSVSTGLLMWERPELSIVIIPLTIVILIYKFKQFCIKPLLFYTFITSLSSIPLILNNIIVTGSITKFPFQAVQNTMGGFHLTSSVDIPSLLFMEIPQYIVTNIQTISIENILGILICPVNGGVGVIPIVMIAVILFIALPYYLIIKRIKFESYEIILILFSFGIIGMYLFTTMLGFNLHAEKGILPDMRYFAIIYAPIVISSLSIISKIYDLLNYKKMIRNFVIIFGVVLVVFTITLSLLSNGIINLSDINLTANMLSGILFAISIAILIDTIRTNRVDGIEVILPAMMSIPLVWQLYASFVTVKLYSYPMLIPLMEVIYRFIFG